MNNHEDVSNSSQTKKIIKNKSFRSFNKKKEKRNINNKLLTNTNKNIIKNDLIKENPKILEIRNSILASLNKRNSFNKLKIKRKNSKGILNNQINEEQKELDKNEILQRIKNRAIDHEINRKINVSSSKISKINNTKQTEIEKTLNDIKTLNKEQQNKFCFYHILSSNHLYFFIPNPKYEKNKKIIPH